MPGPLLTVGAVLMCGHGGKLTVTPNPKVMLSGTPSAQWMPVLPVAGCANPLATPTPAPAPIAPRPAELGLPAGFTAELVAGGPCLSLIHISQPTRPYLSSYAVFCLEKKHTTIPLTISCPEYLLRVIAS